MPFVNGRTLDYRPGGRHPRSAEFPVRPLLGDSVGWRSKTWRKPNVVLDQGPDGACVGFGCTYELLCEPKPIQMPDPYTYAMGVYHQAQLADQWDDTPPAEGTSVDAGLKVLRQRGMVGAFHWANNIDDLVESLIKLGPVVIGIPWLHDMFYPRDSGLLEVSGSVDGGHCVCLHAFFPNRALPGESKLTLIEGLQSWGPNWGFRGRFYITPDDLGRLVFGGDGEAAVITERYAKAA